MLNRNFQKVINERGLDLLKSYGLTAKDFKAMYFEDDKISINNCSNLANALGDLNIVVGVHKFARIQAEKNPYPTYFYRFSYDGGRSLVKMNIPFPLAGK